jgi:hypothetical protein
VSEYKAPGASAFVSSKLELQSGAGHTGTTSSQRGPTRQGTERDALFAAAQRFQIQTNIGNSQTLTTKLLSQNADFALAIALGGLAIAPSYRVCKSDVAPFRMIQFSIATEEQ